jgi:hypothetical protein
MIGLSEANKKIKTETKAMKQKTKFNKSQFSAA